MLKRMQGRLLAVNTVSVMVVVFIAFSSVFVTFRAVVLGEADRALLKALEDYTPARSAFLPLPSEEAFDVTVMPFKDFSGDENLRYRVRTMPDGQRMIAFCDITDEKRMLDRLLGILAAAGGGLSVLVFFISLWVSGRAIAPVAESIRLQNRFVSDISHELKTPLSAISASLELLPPDAAGERWLESVRYETDRMIRLTKSMLGLFSEGDSDFSSVSLSQICNAAMLSFEAMAFEQGVLMDGDIRDGVVVHGSREQLERLVAILLDNAVKYNQSGGFVRLSLCKRHTKAVLCVENTGEHIEDADRIFDRFYREDESRSREGFGLGLSIARKIVSDHGGRISVKSGETNVFSVILGLKKCSNSDIIKQKG